MSKYAKITLLTITFSICFAGSSVSAPKVPEPQSNMGVGASSALMKALTSAKAGMYAYDGGLLKIFVQPRDGASFVRNVEALDTIYFETDTLTEIDSQHVLLTFQTDKTSRNLELLSYKSWVDFPEGTAIFDPTTLPDINFQWVWRQVKNDAGPIYGAPVEDLVLASVGISYAVAPGTPLNVTFQFKPDYQETEYCWSWKYVYYTDTDTGVIEDTYFIQPCWFAY